MNIHTDMPNYMCPLKVGSVSHQYFVTLSEIRLLIPSRLLNYEMKYLPGHFDIYNLI